jgi:N utilization substance protein B
MQLSRREIRESALILIFEKMFRDDANEEIINLAENIDDFAMSIEVVDMFNGVYEKVEELDAVIAKFSEKRTVERIPKINLAILRLAIYEARYNNKVPVNAAISEAVLLAKKYAHEPDVAFVNGVLGAYSRSEENTATDNENV